MFDNLIESSSHRKEFQRRGSFFLFTTAGYALLFLIAGIVGICVYDAHLEDQSTELAVLTFVPPQPDRVIPPYRTVDHHSNPAGPISETPTSPVLIDRPDNPLNTPDEIGSTAPTVPPASTGTIIGPEISSPPGSGADRGGAISGANRSGPSELAMNVGRTPTPSPTPKKIVTAPRILNSQAISLPKPPYPSIARMNHIQGIVNVQVLIDETGKVISAKATSGSPFLVHVAEKAAYEARFSPTYINDQPVKVSGVIIYNFVLQ